MSDIEYQVVDSAPEQDIVALYQAGGWWKDSVAWRQGIAPMIRGSFCFMVARTESGAIVGMGRVISDGVSDAYIQDVVVLRDYRRRGIGAELVRRLTAYCRERRLDWVGLIAEPGTKGFYEALGYRPLVGFQPMLHGGPA